MTGIDRGVILYDGACNLCSGGANRLGPRLSRRGFRMMPLQSPDAQRLADVTPEALMREMHLVTPQRKVLRGVDAFLYICPPLRWLAIVPGVKPAMRAIYARVAERRYRLSRACSISRAAMSREDYAGRWTPPVVWLVLSLLLGSHLSPFAWMWTIALALFAGCKWATWWAHRWSAPWRRSLGYFLAYPGMDAREFLMDSSARRPQFREFIAPSARSTIGATMVIAAAKITSPVIAAWFAMIGIVLTLHFGLLHILPLIWHRAGVAAEPLMHRPTRSRTLAEFWGRRWNTGFRNLAHQFIFAPLAPIFGTSAATGIAFLVSGLVHDLVISLPARGGFGLPTTYFLIQFLGLSLQRRGFLGRGMIARFTTIAVILAPLPLLFHPPFVHRVIVPFITGGPS